MLAEKIHNEDNVWFPNVPIFGFKLESLRYKLRTPKGFCYDQGGQNKKSRACPAMLMIALKESGGFSESEEDLWRYIFCFSKKIDYTIHFNFKRFAFISKKSPEEVKVHLNKLMKARWLRVCEHDENGEYSKLELGTPAIVSEIVEQSIYIQAAERDLTYPRFDNLPYTQYLPLIKLFQKVNYDF